MRFVLLFGLFALQPAVFPFSSVNTCATRPASYSFRRFPRVCTRDPFPILVPRTGWSTFAFKVSTSRDE